MRYVLYLHVLAAAVWFGHKVLIPFDIRASLAAPKQRDLTALIGRVDRAAHLGIASGVLTLLTGLAMVFMAGGFGHVPIRIHVGLGFVLMMFGVGAWMARPAWRRAKALLASGDLATARAPAETLVRALTIEQVLWAIVLGTMVLRF